MIKPITAALLAGAPVALVGRADWLSPARTAFTEGGTRQVLVTDEVVPEKTDMLVYHPATLALGVGCERGADPEELIELVEEALVAHGLAKASIGGVFSIDL
jgi:cobalt-precorrin 5A hydrolase/precorrin-3B C17-methyltransferase